ncbi:hypothetical protein, partial [Dactylosporangium sucinum]|uniref:hypothetical protein n=1 Tax=Dactylosporangium sucinum TaxID=1424081 RepID=UPI001E571106
MRLYTNEAMTEDLAYYSRRRYVETHRAEQDGLRRVFFRKVVNALRARYGALTATPRSVNASAVSGSTAAVTVCSAGIASSGRQSRTPGAQPIRSSASAG